jgi:hypothetical protein
MGFKRLLLAVWAIFFLYSYSGLASIPSTYEQERFLVHPGAREQVVSTSLPSFSPRETPLTTLFFNSDATPLNLLTITPDQPSTTQRQVSNPVCNPTPKPREPPNQDSRHHRRMTWQGKQATFEQGDPALLLPRGCWTPI